MLFEFSIGRDSGYAAVRTIAGVTTHAFGINDCFDIAIVGCSTPVADRCQFVLFIFLAGTGRKRDHQNTACDERKGKKSDMHWKAFSCITQNNHCMLCEADCFLLLSNKGYIPPQAVAKANSPQLI